MATPPTDALDQARRAADLTREELWIRYFALGGMSSPLEVDAYLYGALRPTAHDYDVLALALNERFAELGGDQPVPYADDLAGAPATLIAELPPLTRTLREPPRDER